MVAAAPPTGAPTIAPTLRERPVRAQTRPGEIAAQHRSIRRPRTPSRWRRSSPISRTVIVPGMTHWQHPRFFAYFPANAAPVSVVAEYLVSAMAAQCMLWQTSPAATELETRVDRLAAPGARPARRVFRRHPGFGVVGDAGRRADHARAGAGMAGQPRRACPGSRRLRIYCSDQVHTSIDRAIWVSGIGEENLVRIPAGGRWRGMDAGGAGGAIVADRAAGFLPGRHHRLRRRHQRRRHRRYRGCRRGRAGGMGSTCMSTRPGPARR